MARIRHAGRVEDSFVAALLAQHADKIADGTHAFACARVSLALLVPVRVSSTSMSCVRRVATELCDAICPRTRSAIRRLISFSLP